MNSDTKHYRPTSYLEYIDKNSKRCTSFFPAVDRVQNNILFFRYLEDIDKSKKHCTFFLPAVDRVHNTACKVLVENKVHWRCCEGRTAGITNPAYCWYREGCVH